MSKAVYTKMTNYPGKADSRKPLYKSYSLLYSRIFSMKLQTLYMFLYKKSRMRVVVMPECYIFGPNRRSDWESSVYRAGRRQSGSSMLVSRSSNMVGLPMRVHRIHRIYRIYRIQRTKGTCSDDEVFMSVDMEKSVGSLRTPVVQPLL